MAAIVAVFIAATEALPEVMVVVITVYIEAVIAVIGILIGIGVSVVGTPAILSVRLSRAKTLLIPVVHGSAEQVCAVLIGLVVATSPTVSIARGSGEVGIRAVVVVALILDTQLLLV
jgi:hypothetical protein